jgi:glycosyltransferase involved in cell wall biosynthesis
MKILRIVSSGFLEGGVENGVYLTNKQLRKDGYDVLTISSNLRLDLTHFSDIEFKSIPTSGIKKYFANAFNIDAYKVTRKALEDFKPDVVLLHTMSQATASILFLMRKYPTILFVHGPETFTKSLLSWHMQSTDYKNASYDLKDLTTSGKLRYYYFKYICGLFYSASLGNVDQCIALSHYTLNFLKKEGFKASYIPNGAQLMKVAPLSFDSPIILYAGRVEKVKGVDDLLQAMPAILKEYPTVTLRIAGDGSYKSMLQSEIKALGIEKQVFFLGHRSPTELAREYTKCTIFVLPSIWPETFGKVGIEAMSAGRPVIATDVGGVRDWLLDGKNGYLIKPHRPDQISSKVIAILSNKQAAKKMAEHARSTAERFSIDIMSKNIEKLVGQYVK